MKVPSNLIIKGYTAGKEYVYRKSTNFYIGHFYKLRNKFYTGKDYDPNAKQLEIVPITKMRAINNPNSFLYNFLNNINTIFMEGLVEPVLNMFRNLWAQIKTGFSNLLDGVFGFLSTLGNSISNTLDQIWKKVVSWSKHLIEAITAPFKKAKNFVADLLGLSTESDPKSKKFLLEKTFSPDTQRLLKYASVPSTIKTVNAGGKTQSSVVNSPTNTAHK